MGCLNLTQHAATPDQHAAGVFDLPADVRSALQDLLTFVTLPSEQEILEKAAMIAALAALHASAEDRADEGGTLPADDAGGFALYAMIGGAPWLMAQLSAALREQGIEPVFAFSVRKTEDQVQADGSIRKTSVFRHGGFVPSI